MDGHVGTSSAWKLTPQNVHFRWKSFHYHVSSYNIYIYFNLTVVIPLVNSLWNKYKYVDIISRNISQVYKREKSESKYKFFFIKTRPSP